MLATAGLLELQVAAGIVTAGDVPGMVYGRFMFTVAPDEVVPIAMKLTLALVPVVSEVCEAGRIARETRGSAFDPVTVKVAVWVTTLPSGFFAWAVITVVPWPTAVARPPPAPPVWLLMVATEVLLEAHVSVPLFVRSRVPGVEEVGEKVPMAINWLV
jgi:hypothetical protein